jgi:glycosyltransferase involved in cell wall biosynthesis
LARIPIVFLGKPYAPEDPYFLEFKSCVDDQIVRYPGFVSTLEKYRYLRGARGFVLLSQYESGCIAAYEAAATGLPLLLSDLPWASMAYRETRGVEFVPLHTVESAAGRLAAFYDQAHRRGGTTFPILSWRQVATKYLEIYNTILGRA